MSDSLSKALSNSLNVNITTLVANIAEVGIDAFLNDELCKSIPLLSTVISIYKIGENVNDLHLLRKLASFLQAMNDGLAKQDDIDKHKAALLSEPKQRSKEIEFLLIIINRYISENKPILLAKIYLAYLDNEINWDTVTTFAEIIDRLLPGDYEYMKENNDDSIIIHNYRNSDKASRLNAVGIVEPVFGRIVANVIPEMEENESDEYLAVTGEYRYTSLGRKFKSIINKY